MHIVVLFLSLLVCVLGAVDAKSLKYFCFESAGFCQPCEELVCDHYSSLTFESPKECVENTNCKLVFFLYPPSAGGDKPLSVVPRILHGENSKATELQLNTPATPAATIKATEDTTSMLQTSTTETTHSSDTETTKSGSGSTESWSSEEGSSEEASSEESNGEEEMNESPSTSSEEGGPVDQRIEIEVSAVTEETSSDVTTTEPVTTTDITTDEATSSQAATISVNAQESNEQTTAETGAEKKEAPEVRVVVEEQIDFVENGDEISIIGKDETKSDDKEVAFNSTVGWQMGHSKGKGHLILGPKAPEHPELWVEAEKEIQLDVKIDGEEVVQSSNGRNRQMGPSKGKGHLILGPKAPKHPELWVEAEKEIQLDVKIDGEKVVQKSNAKTEEGTLGTLVFNSTVGWQLIN